MNIHHPTGGKPNGAQPARSVHPGSGRRRTRAIPEGAAGRPAGAGRGPGAARRPPAPARPADRAPPPDPGPLRPPAARAPRGARRGDAAGPGRGLRGRHRSTPTSTSSRRARPRPRAHRPRLRQPDLRAAGGGRAARRARRAARPGRPRRPRPLHGRAATARPGRGRRPAPRRARDGRARSRRRSQPGDRSGHAPIYIGFDAYVAAAATGCSRDCRDGPRDRADDVAATIEASGLRGLGGAGFRSGAKWRLVRQSPAPRLMAINADEGEPGTFKDRHYLETDPHRFLEGMLIAAWAVEAEEVYIYLRDEYPHVREILHARDRRARGARGWPARPRSTCAAAPGRTSAARRRRCSRASKGSAATRATSRRSRPRSACSAGRR